MTAYETYRLLTDISNDAQIFVQEMKTGEKSAVIQLVIIPVPEGVENKLEEVVLQY